MTARRHHTAHRDFCHTRKFFFCVFRAGALARALAEGRVARDAIQSKHKLTSEYFFRA